MKLFLNQSFIGSDQRINDGVDRAAFGLMDADGVNFEKCIFDAKSYEEAMKLSFCKNITFNNCDFYGGYEDCVDIVGGENFKFTNCRFHGSGKVLHHFTIKGSAKDVLIDNCQFFGKAKESTIIAVGNFSNYDIKKRPETSNIRIANSHSSSGSIFFALALHAKNVSVSNVKHKSWLSVFFVPKFVYKTYFHLRANGIIGSKPKPDPRRM
jgi:hypothetical protein